MGTLTEKLMIDLLIIKGKIAIKQIDKIAPNYRDYYYSMLNRIINENKDTVYGKKHNFSNIKNYEDYINNVPLSSYSDYASMIDKISIHGEQNIFTKKPVVQFAMTSGSTAVPKLIPLIQDSIDLCTAYTAPYNFAIVDKALKQKGRKLPREKGLVLIDLGLLAKTESGLYKGGISGASIRKNLKLLEKIISSPKEIICSKEYLDSKYLHLLFALKERNLSWISSSYMTVVASAMDYMESNWQMLCDDIENGVLNPDIKMSDETRKILNSKLTKDPIRANELRKIFKDGFDNRAVAKLVWPKLSTVIAIGSGGFKIHADKVRRFVGDDVVFSSIVIESSESLIAVASKCDSEDFTIVPQVGFFEFIPEDDNTKVLPMDKLEVGKKYELVLTTISGLYRYQIGDVIKVTGYYGQIPIIQFSHRANVFLNIAGEKTTEADLLRAIKYFEDKTNIKVAEYCAYANTESTPGNYVLLLEPSDKIDINRLKEYETIIEEGLKITFGYKYERQDNNINHSKLYFQQKETHLVYRELQIMKGALRNQLKPVRVLRTPEQIAFFTKMIEK